MPRILTIFHRTGTSSYPEAEAELAGLYATQLPGIDRDVVVVDNALPPGVAEEQAGRIVLGGDNSASEFSGIDAALAWLGPRVHRYDLVNLVTSAFRQLYVAYLERFRPDVVAALIGRRACIGHIDCYNEPIEVLSYRSQHWLRTSFVMLPPRELMLVGTMVSVRPSPQWFSGRAEAPFADEAPLSATYRKYLLDWLLGEDIGQGVRWHKTMSLEGEGLAVFERKATAILNEHLFGIRLRAAGCRVIDVTWLSTMIGAGRPVDWTTPWWQQLAERDRDAMRIEPPAPAASALVAASSPVEAGQPAHDQNAAYDLQTTEVMRRVLGEASACLDIGAHEGSVLREMVTIAPRGAHHAFEPLPHLAARLRTEFPAVTIHEAAVSDAPGRARYVFVENAPAYSGLREREYDRPDPRKTLLDVSVVRIDDVVPPDTPVDFIKLDIEGGEFHALRGAARTIERRHPVIVFEASARSTGKYGVTPEDMFTLLEGEFGYRLSTMQRWLLGAPPMSVEEFARNWYGGPEYYFIAYRAT
ncbi:MAG: FkbM family methyltransferase [Vicinamibacterales bacterium]